MIRSVIDKELKLPTSLKLFDKTVKTIVFNYLKNEDDGLLLYSKLSKEKNILSQIVFVLYEQQIQSVMVEGGAKLLQSFIDAGLWDEARVICNEQLTIGNGLSAPVLKDDILLNEETIDSDVIHFYTRRMSGSA